MSCVWHASMRLKMTALVWPEFGLPQNEREALLVTVVRRMAF